MARRLSFILIFFSLVLSLSAQKTYTEHLRSQKGKGTLRVIQSKEIDKAVDASNKQSSASSKTQTGSSEKENTESSFAPDRVKPEKMMGFRVQIYAGPKATGKEIALQYEKKFKEKFQGVSTYVRFVQPRWTCRIGDFQTREDAQVFLNKIQEEKISNQAAIVRCEIFKVY